jgi:BirA family biotin operon repressor/biotin-[acetyl-CoA-carboxylase] ligase
MAMCNDAPTPILVFDTLDSTNTEARRRAEAGQASPLWLMARRQSAGRGRRGRTWEGGEGNLYATLLLTLDKPPIEAAQLAFVAALAVADLAAAYIPAGMAGLKWPNDLLIEGRKAAGVLIESGPAHAGGRWAAVGIGVNLAWFPQDVDRPATALVAHLRHDIPRAPTPDEAIERLSAAFDARLSRWLDQGFEPTREAWLGLAIGMGGDCRAQLPAETVFGAAEGLDADGALLLRLPDGGLRRITAGDVFFGPI